MVIDIFKFISEPITQWLKNRSEVKAAKHDREIAIIQNQARLASDKESYNHEWEMASLKNSDSSLRFMSFFVFVTPILVTVVFPEYGAKIWENLVLVPQWWFKTFMMIIGCVWGVSKLKDGIPQVINAINKSKEKAK